MENLQPDQPVVAAKPPRPVFLTVLCILTFIGSSWGIISGITSYLSANATSGIAQAAMQDAREKVEDEDNAGSKFAEKILSGTSEMLQPENLRKSALFSIIASVFTLLGGILMFGLKKTGFYSYVLGTAIGIAGPFIAFGGGNFLTILSSSFIAFIGILFVILYGLNVKHLR
ncbi:hypothetical protein [Agriterribacter sp.]|uniref:hypothetical protein n=1 Tax=Agriterribacter sp. TaxID=2821509 RepID=UPI002C54037C|nr:hypothetical protein [Agriterribacter sp.]HRO46795.1 hypothetical protein [Agriterribacter sp.]HRQ15596.1 hypothetical protein [Agriterribacter sp.]